jgi:hypothetical protein
MHYQTVKASFTGVVDTGDEFLTGVNDTGNACIAGLIEAPNNRTTLRIFKKKSQSFIGMSFGTRGTV